MQRNRLEKIVLSVGVGRMRQLPNFEEKILPDIIRDLSIIAGQHPSKRGAKKAIANFKTREGDVIGLMVTLRGKKMRDFLSRLINVVLPRVRDFRGIDIGHFDERGNLSIGIKEHTTFPEINPEKTNHVFGVQITFTTNTRKREDGIELMRNLALPLKKV